MVWSLSLTGWRLSGELPLRVGQTCPLTVTWPNQVSLFVAGAIVRWVRGEEYGVETLVMDDESQDDKDDYLAERIDSTMEPGH